MSKDIDQLFKDNLVMYPHLKVIRDNLWAKDGKSRVSVMIGAGFSLNAKKIVSNFSGMALWDDLKNRLMKNLSHHPDIKFKDVLEIGQIYVEEYGRSGLDEILKESIPDDNYEPDKLHYELLNLPWTDVFTTNYDTLLERAKKSVYERNYQVIYDINDIPSSTQPRIVKLHGSFPANRPFIFTKKDYDNYPEKFSPFVNMVQQSIMETTFILLGFSGEDPNFEKWTTWVRDNLGEQMPKIYMIGYGQNNRQEELNAKGITLIDFKNIYIDHDDPYSEMFSDLFEFLSYKEREEKTKWPHRAYNTYEQNMENLKYNRQTYPGWVVMPDEIRRTNAESIRLFGKKVIEEIDFLNDDNVLELLNEILWCYEKFYIPLDYYVQGKLQKLLQDFGDKLDKRLIPMILCLLQEARLDCNKVEFDEYKSFLDNIPLSTEQKHSYIHEQILFYSSLNNMEEVEKILHEWNVGTKEVEWGIKKAIILARNGRREDAKFMFEEYLQTVRNLLVVQMDDYRLLSLESVVLHNRNRITKQWNYGQDRLRALNNKNCDTNKVIDQALVSVKNYEYTLGTREFPGFDPGSGKTFSSMGDYMKQELLDSYAVLQMQERYGLSINNKSKYELALINLEILYALYSQIKRIQYVSVKKIDDIFSREFVYKLDDYKLEILVEILEKTIQGDSQSNIDINVALEILSRIYFALTPHRKLELDLKIIRFLNQKDQRKDYDQQNIILVNLIKRMMFDKNNKDAKLFCERLVEADIKSQLKIDEYTYKNEYFEPLLVIFSDHGQVSNLNISTKKLLDLISDLYNTDDYSIRESALIRLTFLDETCSLSEEYHSKFISFLQTCPKDRELGISDFIFSYVFDRIIQSTAGTSEHEQLIFLEKDISTFYSVDSNQRKFSFNVGVDDYFNELTGIFPDYIGVRSRKKPEYSIYKSWLEKFYTWWDSQKEGLLRNINEESSFLRIPDYLKKVITALKNNIWGVIERDYIDEADRIKASQIFCEIDNKRPDVSIYLVPCLCRLNIEVRYSLDDVLRYLSSKEIDKVQAATSILYDYLFYIDAEEILEDGSRIKKELLNMLHYSSSDFFKAAVDALHYCMKNVPSVFDEAECILISEFANNYFQSIKNRKIKIELLKDFEILSSFAGLVAFMYKNKNYSTRDGMDEWKEYIIHHRLPEIRQYTDLII